MVLAAVAEMDTLLGRSAELNCGQAPSIQKSVLVSSLDPRSMWRERGAEGPSGQSINADQSAASLKKNAQRKRRREKERTELSVLVRSPAESCVYSLEFREFQAQLHWIQLLFAVIFPQSVCCSQALLLKIESLCSLRKCGEDP